jgi:hypothetical protein
MVCISKREWEWIRVLSCKVYVQKIANTGNITVIYM